MSDKHNDIPMGGVHSIDEVLDSELVRTEFLSPTFQAKITLQYSRFRFNAAAVRLFSDTQFVQILVDRKRRRIFAVPCGEYSPCRVKWCNVKADKRQSRDCMARDTCMKLYEMMNWIPENRYKIMAVYQEIEGYRLLVFNLIECEMMVSETIIRDDGKTVKKIKVIRPLDWIDTFGNPYRDHAEAYKVDINEHYLLADNLTGAERDYLLNNNRRPVQPREPNPVEIMGRQYGGVETEE